MHPNEFDRFERIREMEEGSVLRVLLDDQMGHLAIEHDGTVTWDDLQRVKTAVWGGSARAIEVYPAEGQIVNSADIRHLWRLAEDDFAPDRLGDDRAQDSLQSRCAVAWAEARA